MRWRWIDSRARVTYLVTALMLELLPFEGALLLVTASDNHPIDGAAVPLWYSAGVLLLASAAGRALRGRPRSRALVLTSPGIAASYLLLLWVSPAALAGVPRDPFQAPAGARAGGHDLTTVLVALLAAACYLWFRGLAVGEGVPGPDVILRRFRNGLTALVVVILALPAIAMGERGALVGILTVLLPGEIFCGLTATSSARLVAQRESQSSSGTVRPWLALSTFVASLVSGLALFLGLVLNGAALHEALGHMGPLGDALDTLASAVGQAVATSVRVVLGGLFSLTHVNPVTRPLQPVQPATVCRGTRCQIAVKPPAAFGIMLDLLLVLLTVGVLALVIYVAYRLVRGLASRPEDIGIQEEREMLDGRAIFARQLRGLFGRRRPVGLQLDDEALPPDNVRALYRDLLLAAAGRGLPRRSVETPDEYAARLATSASPIAQDATTTRDDLVTLTQAYNGARYGQHEPDTGTFAGLRLRLGRLLASLRAGR